METAMRAVLVLNATYEPLNIVPVQRAFVLLLKEKAEIVEAAKMKLRAEHLAIDWPLVIRLVAFVPVPRRLPLPLSRRTVMARDLFTCQYCGGQPGKHELTIDHNLTIVDADFIARNAHDPFNKVKIGGGGGTEHNNVAA